MDFLQTKIFNQTKFNFTALKKQKTNHSGFITVFSLAFLSLIMTGLIGFASLSLGIKNITQSQSLCIKQTLKTQNSLSQVLSQLLALNKTASSLNKSRKTAEASIATATASVILVPKVPALIKARDALKFAQKTLIFRQKQLLLKSLLIKKKALRHLKQSLKKIKAHHIQELTFYKKALAVQKEKIGQDAYIYKPVPDFINQQKISFQWVLPLFYPLDKNWSLLKRSQAKYSCTSSLKQKGEKWLNILYH